VRFERAIIDGRFPGSWTDRNSASAQITGLIKMLYYVSKYGYHVTTKPSRSTLCQSCFAPPKIVTSCDPKYRSGHRFYQDLDTTTATKLGTKSAMVMRLEMLDTSLPWTFWIIKAKWWKHDGGILFCHHQMCQIEPAQEQQP
jgi:hypothetical protein